MKNKQGFTIYWEDCFYPAKFRVRLSRITHWQRFGPNLIREVCSMDTILTGWVQDETHLQWEHQSLQ